MASLADEQPPAAISREGRGATTPQINVCLQAEEFMARAMVISSVHGTEGSGKPLLHLA